MNEDLEQYIEDRFKQSGEDLYECDGGHVWHIDMIEEAYREDCQDWKTQAED